MSRAGDSLQAGATPRAARDKPSMESDSCLVVQVGNGEERLSRGEVDRKGGLLDETITVWGENPRVYIQRGGKSQSSAICRWGRTNTSCVIPADADSAVFRFAWTSPGGTRGDVGYCQGRNCDSSRRARMFGGDAMCRLRGTGGFSVRPRRIIAFVIAVGQGN